ncbi:hypothetical protein LPC04_16265 [Comamonadaceae bacterium BS-T2-15]|uniref:Uncharacterized protein n=1 Tax=Scleromatobacter humisilvae TaxID=2897159 RepID=A0A9X1YRG1_9BURK|nr:hypothetical protein [Scleromatobacter humisilvae]MCK9687261.1 hypothetical protein [Scleromatobacter humisilvae]
MVGYLPLHAFSAQLLWRPTREVLGPEERRRAAHQVMQPRLELRHEVRVRRTPAKHFIVPQLPLGRHVGRRHFDRKQLDELDGIFAWVQVLAFLEQRPLRLQAVDDGCPRGISANAGAFL